MENSEATEHFGVYSNTQIQAAIASGHIVCTPYNPSHLNGSSLDLTLGEYFYRTSKDHSSIVYNPYDPAAVEDYFGSYEKALTHSDWCTKHGVNPLHNIAPDQQILVLEPGERILAHTNEFVGIKPPGTSSIQARSTWGRNGVSICFDAGWGDPGYINRWTLEIYNLNKFHRVVMLVGERIAQIIFMHTGKVEGGYTQLSGKYQTSNDLESLIENWEPEAMLPQSYKDIVTKPLRADHVDDSKGKYIVIEGSDGVGKTTQACLLYYRLAKAGVPMCGFMLAEPGGVYRLDSPEDALAFPNWKPETYAQQCLNPSALAISQLIKNKSLIFDPKTRLLLHTAAHRVAWEEATRNALSQGLTVIATRNWVSALAYQGYGDGVDKKIIETMTRDFVGETYLSPDATLVIHYDDENDRMRRITERGEEISVHEEKNADFQQRVNDGYRDVARLYGLEAVDADGSVDDVHGRIWRCVAPIFNFKEHQFPIYNEPTNTTQKKIREFTKDGIAKLHIVLDFDRTLSMNGDPGTFDILKSYLPEAGKNQYDMLFQHYRPHDEDGSLTVDESALWTASIIDLLHYHKVNVHDIETDALEKATLRPHVREFFTLCDTLNIPIVIISAGVKEVIDLWCKHNGISPALILANNLIDDNDDETRARLVHPLNKHNSNHPERSAITSKRPNIILVGDSLNDWNMASGENSVLRILVRDTPLTEDTKKLASERFDMTLGVDAFETVAKIIKEIRDDT